MKNELEKTVRIATADIDVIIEDNMVLGMSVQNPKPGGQAPADFTAWISWGE